MSSPHSLCFLTRALVPETSASDMGCVLIMHCSIIFCNIENDRKIRNFIIPNPEALLSWKKQSPDMYWSTLAVHLLAGKAMHSERCSGHFYTEEVKETLLNNGEGLEEVPESGLNLSPALGSPWSCLLLSNNSSHGKWHFSPYSQEMHSGNQQIYASTGFL